MKKFYCIICGIFFLLFSVSVAIKKEKIFTKEEPIDILKILGLIKII